MPRVLRIRSNFANSKRKCASLLKVQAFSTSLFMRVAICDTNHGKGKAIKNETGRQRPQLELLTVGEYALRESNSYWFHRFQLEPVELLFCLHNHNHSSKGVFAHLNCIPSFHPLSHATSDCRL